MKKRYLIPIVLGALALGGCGSKEIFEREVSINNSNYSVAGQNIVQTNSSFLEDGEINIGIVSDIEGAIERAKASAEKLKTFNLDALIIAGDCYENERIRRDHSVFPNSTNNVQEMVEGIKPYAELGVPVFVIAGNHEVQSVYNKAIKKLQERYPNVFDINERAVDLKGVNIVGMGGYHQELIYFKRNGKIYERRFIPKDGFKLKKDNYSRAEEDLNEFQVQKEPTIFVTHGPPKSQTTIDLVAGAGHVGDDNTRTIMNSDLENVINVHGHIHEGGSNSDNYKAGVSINIASITSYNNRKGANAGLITIKDGKVSYQFVK